MSDYWKKRQEELNQSTSKSYWSQRSDDLNKVQKKQEASKAAVKSISDDDIAPVKDDTPWYKSGHFEDGWQFGDVTKSILGLETKKEKEEKSLIKTYKSQAEIAKEFHDGDSTYTAPTLDELAKKRDTSKSQADKLKYTQLYNQEYLAQTSQTLAKTKMDGTNRSILEEMEAIAKMDSGKEKRKRKKAVLEKMEAMGIDTDDYALFIEDKNFTAENFFRWLGSATKTGLNNFNMSLANTAEKILGDPLEKLGWENNPISKLDDYYTALYESSKYNQDLYKQKLGAGGGMQFAGEFVEGTTAALPNMLLAIMTAGKSLEGTAAGLMQNAAYQGANILQKAGMTGLNMIKDSQFWLSFARSYGNDYDEAISKGVDDKTAAFGATLSSLLNAGFEIGLDGKSGIQGLPSDLKEGVGKFLPLVQSAFEESGEEGAQKLVNEAINRLVYGSDEEVLNPIEYGKEMFLGGLSGLALGGGQIAFESGVNAYNQIQSNKLTDIEQKVYDKVVADEIAKAKENGEVTKKDETKIRNDVRTYLEKGYISTDTIEEVLGEDAKNLVNNSRLAESYRESERIYEDLDIDPDTFKDSKHADAARQTIESALALKANNTNRVRDLVENSAQIAAETGKAIVFKDNETVKNSFIERQTRAIAKLESKENKTENEIKLLEQMKQKLSDVQSGKIIVNGDYSKDGIVVNIDSKKPIMQTVGHEITHNTETAKSYDKMRDALFAYANTKGIDVQTRIDMTKLEYEGIEDAVAEREVVADLVGEMLFTDDAFVEHLAKTNTNVFQSLWNDIKHLISVVTPGSKDAKELEALQYRFEKAYREANKEQKNATKDGGVKYSVGVTTDGRFVAVVDNDILSKIDTSTWDKETKKKVQKAANEELKKFNNGFTINGVEYLGNKRSRSEYTRSDYSEALASHDQASYLDKMRASSVLDDVVRVATGWKNDNELKYDRDDYVDFVRGNTLIKSGNNTYKAVVLAGITEDGKAVFHDVVDVAPEKFEIKNSESYTTESANDSPNGILKDSDAFTLAQEEPTVNEQNEKVETITEEQNEHGLDTKAETEYSLSRNTEFMDKAIEANKTNFHVSSDSMTEAKGVRDRVANRMNEIKDRGLVGLPEDIEGNTYIANSSYDGTEENTTICPRSLASEAFVDAVSEYLGRPLSIEEQIYISQDLQGRSLTPECTYCYVATDRKAYRAFLGDYITQRDAVLDKIKADPNADVSRKGDLYKEFLNGRKDTNPMYNRFKMWVDAYKSGKPMVEASHLANISKLMGDINSEFGAELKPQIVDAMKYAQSASWAKKRVNYVAYNGHILKWKQDRINKLNNHYGLRMYSFSDFHPAFVLENMQMITDASVRGLKMLGYTKDTDFVEIFAPSGMNINVSTFGFETGGNVYENNIIGAQWDKAKALRDQYPNVGITFVATSDTIVEWALKQDWIDVVIPYHLVRTGAEVAKAFGYTNYTSESSDTKDTDWTKGKDEKYIAPTEHNNDKATYMAALEKNHLKPRFERFIDDPNYMKLVNESRQPASKSKPVQPVFNEDAAMVALAKLEANGYYQPIGGSVDKMYEIASEVAEDMKKQLAPTTQYSLSRSDAEYEADDRFVTGENFRVRQNAEAIAPVQKTAESTAYEDGWQDALDSITDNDVPPVVDNTPPKEITTVAERIEQKIKNAQEELEKNRSYLEQTMKDYDEDIASAKAELNSKKNLNTKAAQTLRQRIERLKRMQADIRADYSKRISDLEARVEKLHSSDYRRAEQRRDKQAGYTKMWEDMIGDTSTWKDMPIGLQYKTKTLRRILRKVVRDANGNADFQKADRIYDELETMYDHNEAELKKESQNLKEAFFDLNLNNAEDTYAHMLGEFKYNPETTLTEDMVKEFYESNKNKIDKDKVDKAIAEARKTFDDLIVRVNEVLREQGMKEIPYRKGYFPHFTNPKQGWLAKLLNWKTIDTEIPTSIAGLTEAFKPQRSWQSFNKQRKGDTTDYSLYQGLDTYIHGALDWIYHIEDIQKRRALENHIRFIHSEEGVQKRIQKIKAGNYDADEAQTLINAVLEEADNPLSGLVRELMNRTNTLANKKSSLDRSMEDATNRKIYSTMTNLNNRINANMVVGSFSSALTNFIPIVQSWHQVSPYYTVKGLRDFVQSTVVDDGTIAKSDYLTNRLMEEEKLYQTGWDKVIDKAAFMMDAIDNIASQTVWRSKYLQNLGEGMSEAMAIRDADQFSKNLMAGRSRGNAPTIFDAKNPIVKLFSAFQLEVANQYGFMFEDTPQDSKNKARLIKGYATAFMGAYLYNTLYSTLTGRDAALDPIGLIEDLLKDLFDDEDEEDLADNLLAFGEEIAQEVPFVGGLLGGGRVPISSALPYSSDQTPFKSMINDVEERNWKKLGKEFLKPLYYLALPAAGGQIKKTAEGLNMFSDDHPVAGSYTDSGKLRFPVEDTPWNRLQAGLFGQYSSKNAREYFDEDIAPLGEEQIREYSALEMPIQDYWDYRDTAKKLADEVESGNASDETILKSKYLNSVGDELSELLKEERELNEDITLNEEAKQNRINEIHERFDELSREAYESYNDVTIDGEYANVGNRYFKWQTPENGEPHWQKMSDDQVTKYLITKDATSDYATNGEVYYKRDKNGEWNKMTDDQVMKYRITTAAGDAYYATNGNLHYRRDEDGEWTKISDKELARQREVTSSLGITANEYWKNTDTSYIPMRSGEYEYAYENPESYAMAKAVGGYDVYQQYSSELGEIKADKDKYGKTISGSRKKKIQEYIKNMDADPMTKIILYKSQYTSFDDYNYEICEYLNNREDISREEMLNVLRKLDFKVDAEGNIYW